MSSALPKAGPSPIDRDHLDRMTSRDRKLEREVLMLFRDQSSQLLQRLKDAPDDFAALIHTLKGSARAIGAFQVARSAERLENLQCSERRDALLTLGNAVGDAKRAIDEILGGA